MAEVTVMASVRMEALGPGPDTVSPIALKKYLDVNDISGPQGSLSVTANGGSIPEGSGPSDGAATLINAINAIPPEQTIRTTISMTITYTPPKSSDEFFGGDTSGMVNESMYGGKFFIIIDWEGGTVTWNGNQRVEQSRYNGSAEVPGDQLIERFSFTEADPGTFGHPISLMLKTTSERKISGLPIPGIGRRLNEAVFQKLTSLWDGFVDVDYVITTDTGTGVIVAPTPPPPVVSVKISELPTAPSLQDDDLFILSQDKPDDGTYDISYHVALASLKAAVAPDLAIHAKAYITVGGVVSNDSNIDSVNVTAGGAGQYTYEINLTTPAVAGAIVSIAPQASTVVFDANADTEYKWVTASQLRVFTFQSNNEGLSVIVLA